MTKPFLSYQEQLVRLNNKGILCTESDEIELLISKGYFNLVNGYKKPFIKSKDINGDHCYHEGTRLRDIAHIFKFDRNLSNLLLSNLTHIEEEIRSITAYHFDYFNQKQNSGWTDRESYDSKVHNKEIYDLINKLHEEVRIAKENQNEYIVHYANTIGIIPTWVMIKVIRLTTFTTFLLYSKKEVKETLCRLYGIEYISQDNNFRVLFGAINWMRKVRNATAHNERIIFLMDSNRIVITDYHKKLTTIYRNRLRNKQIIDLLIFLKYFNKNQHYSELINFILEGLSSIQKSMHSHVFENVRSSLGIRSLEHLHFLRDIPKEMSFQDLL